MGFLSSLDIINEAIGKRLPKKKEKSHTKKCNNTLKN